MELAVLNSKLMKLGGRLVGEIRGKQKYNLPPMTLRIRYIGANRPRCNKGEYFDTELGRNIIDWYCPSSDWSYAFNGENNYIDFEVIDCGDTSNVRSTAYMFENCQNFMGTIAFDTSNVTNMDFMFSRCFNKLNEIPEFDTSSVESARYMFHFTQLRNIPTLDLSNLIDATGMFSDAQRLRAIPDFNLSSVKYCSDMFMNCSEVQSGMLNTYNKLSSNAGIEYNYLTFAGCGINGGYESSIERQQIPRSWGGLLG